MQFNIVFYFRAENDIKEDDSIVKEEPGHNLRRTSFRYVYHLIKICLLSIFH